MTKSKNRKIADLISTGSAFADGSVAASEVTGLGTAATAASTDFATAAQGTLAANALQPTGDGSGLSGILLPNGSGANLTNLPITPSLNNISTEAFGSSGTFTAKTAGTYVIQLVGGGGSGAYVGMNAPTSVGIQTGGAGGGYCRLKVVMDAGDTLAIVIGAGGSGGGGSANGASGAVVKQGYAGGNSTCQGSNIGSGNVTVNMAANGGGGGNAQTYTRISGSTTAIALDSDAGGTASGGDENYTGGQSRANATQDEKGIMQFAGSFSLYSDGSGDQTTAGQNRGQNQSDSNANSGVYEASVVSFGIHETIAMPFYSGGINGVQPYIPNNIYGTSQNREYRTFYGGRGCGGGAGMAYWSNDYMSGSAGGSGFCYVTLFGTV